MSKRKRSLSPVVVSEVVRAQLLASQNITAFQGVNDNLGSSDDPRPLTKLQYTTTSELQELLDFSALSKDLELNSRFKQIATSLLYDYRLVLTSRKHLVYEFEILELEFYLYKSGCHEDPFTHGSEEQKQSGRW